MSETGLTERLLTVEEFARLPGSRWMELVDGRIVEVSPPGARHGRVAVRLAAALDAHVVEHELGAVFVESGYLLSRAPDKLRGPDISFVSASRLPDPMPEGFLALAPDLAVEVVSPNDAYADVAACVAEYLEAGAQEVWVVDPRRHLVERHRQGGHPEFLTREMTLETPLLPGLGILLVDVFA